ncbi:hypothetical protein [Dyella terrae]|uniref:hypothetical protein n=1 Tax=Dyella terrae TaxID=522259 RepID=UPI001EFE76B7|nr:hypothetical protein [Dyella terrae]ULU26625.1 hypothetical protein DYST_03571 [Dyella terrae]
MHTESIQQELTPHAVRSALRVGADNGQTAEQLVVAILGHRNTAAERQLRDVIVALRMAGHAICAEPTHGYYIAANSTELNRACEFLLARSMTSLRQISAMRRVAMPDLRGQLGLPLEKTHESA